MPATTAIDAPPARDGEMARGIRLARQLSRPVPRGPVDEAPPGAVDRPGHRLVADLLRDLVASLGIGPVRCPPDGPR